MESAKINYKKLSELRKVMLLEEAVFTGDLKAVEEVIQGCGTFEFTARALGFACRFGSLKMVQSMVKGGAAFPYDYRNSVLQGKYSFFDNVKYNWGEHAQFELMLLADDLSDRERFGWLSNAPDGAWTRAPIPEEERLEILRWLCTSRKAKCDKSALLYFAILWDKGEAVRILRENGAVLKGTDLYELKSAQASHRRKALAGSLEAMEPKCRERALLALLDVLKDQRAKLAVTPSLLQLALVSQPVTQRLLDEGDYEKLDGAKLVAGAVETGSAATLVMLLERGFVKTPTLRDRLLEMSISEKKVEHTAVLLDYKNRTADLEKEAAAKDARDLRELTAEPDSAYALKKMWSAKKQEDGSLMISGYKGSLKEVTVPAKIGKAAVTAVGEYAFSPNALRLTVSQRDARIALLSVTISKGLTQIGTKAFYNCENLQSVTIPESVTKIGSRAFHRCKSLTSVTIPAGVTEIGSFVFYSCAGLKSVTILEGVTEIGESAFEGCANLTSVTIPASVTKIGYNAFQDCKKLTSVTIPAGVTEIGGYAFYGCEQLTIHAPAGSAAEEYAKKKRNIKFEAIVE